jgi:hypothetical protein
MGKQADFAGETGFLHFPELHNPDIDIQFIHHGSNLHLRGVYSSKILDLQRTNSDNAGQFRTDSRRTNNPNQL